MPRPEDVLKCRTQDTSGLSLFDHVYAEMTEELAAERAGFEAYLESFEGSATGGGH